MTIHAPVCQNPTRAPSRSQHRTIFIGPDVQVKSYNQKNPGNLRTYKQEWYPPLHYCKEYSQVNLLPTNLINRGPHTMDSPKQSLPGPCFTVSLFPDPFSFSPARHVCAADALSGHAEEFLETGKPHSPTLGVYQPQDARVPPESSLLLLNRKWGPAAACCHPLAKIPETKFW